MRRPNGKKGFTLVELMVVIAIMVILAATATPVFSGYIRRARAAEYLTQCRSLYVAAQTCLESQEAANIRDRSDFELEEEVASLAGLDDVTLQLGNIPENGESAVTGYSFYVEDGKCTAVIYKDEKNGTWIFQAQDGTFTEMK